MRRSACLLALLGMAAQPVIGNDYFGPSSGTQPPSATSSSGLPPAAPPQRFTRSAQPTPGENELRKYYDELLSTDGSGSPTAGSAPPWAEPQAELRTRLRPAGKAPVTAVPSEESVRVIQAEYEREAARKDSGVVPVKATQFGNQPFAAGDDQFEQAPAEPRVPSRSSLTQPIPIGGDAPSTGTQSRFQMFGPGTGDVAEPAEAPRESRGSVMFTQGPARQTETPTRPMLPASTPALNSSLPTAATTISASESRPATPELTFEWRKQSEFNVGQQCPVELVVKNTGKVVARGVEAEAHFPKHVRLVSANPHPNSAQDSLVWHLGELAPEQERVLKVTLVPLQPGQIETRADVRFSSTSSATFAVSEPKLGIKLEGPQSVHVGDPASHLLTVQNPGTGIARNVRIEAFVPEGLEHARGQHLLMNLGNINPGETRNVRLALAAVQGGEHQLDVQATADSGLAQTASTRIMVVAPSLKTGINGPSLRYLGRPGVFQLQVVNDGAAATDNVQVRYKIPSNFDYVRSDRGAQFDASNGLLTWFVGRLERNQRATVNVTLTAKSTGESRHLVRATSEHGALSDAEMTTLVEGTSSLSLRVRDLEDPVEVGRETVYEIQVTNEGSAAAHAVGVACELPQGMTFLRADGPAQSITEGQRVVFRSIPELGAGETLKFQVHVSTEATGHMRIRAQLTSDSIPEPLKAEELTRFYGE